MKVGIDQWRGEPIEDKSILVWSDQGLGDSIMLARYIPLIKARRVVVYTDAAVFRLLRHSLPGCEVLMRGWAFPKTDLHVPFMSLMQCFNVNCEADIVQGRYLHPPKKFYPAHDRMLIGVNWQGNKSMARDFTRSMPFATFRPVLDFDGAQFVSLQKGLAQKELAATSHVMDRMDECHDLCDTASLMDGLDLIISTDTSIPHLAGALGKQTWLLESYESEWRWGLGPVSPWYHNVRVFRQPKPNDWTSVIAKVMQELNHMKIDDDSCRRLPIYSVGPTDYPVLA